MHFMHHLYNMFQPVRQCMMRPSTNCLGFFWWINIASQPLATAQILLASNFDSGSAISRMVKGCVRYIFATLLCVAKRECFWNKKKCCFFFQFESSFRSWDNQILIFQVFRYCDVIKCLSVKHKTHFIE